MRSSGGSSRSRLIRFRLSADHPAGLRVLRVEKRAEIMDNLARLKLDSYGRFPRNHQHLGKRQKRYEEAAKRAGHVEVRSTDERIFQVVEGEVAPPYPRSDDRASEVRKQKKGIASLISIDLSGKTAIITGSGQGLGARTLAGEPTS